MVRLDPVRGLPKICLLVLLGVVSGACSFAHSVAEVTAGVATHSDTAEATHTRVAADWRVQEGLWNRLRGKGIDSELPPYPAVQKNLDRMEKGAGDIRRGHQRIVELRRELDRLTQGKTQVAPEDSEHLRVTEIKHAAQSEADAVAAEARAYDKARAALVEHYKKHRIEEITVADVEASAEDFVRNLQGGIAALHNKVAEVRRAAEGRGRERELAEMERTLHTLEEERQRFRGLMQRFRSEVAGHQTLVAGPGMTTYKIMDELRQSSRKVRAAQEEIDDLIDVMRFPTGGVLDL